MLVTANNNDRKFEIVWVTDVPQGRGYAVHMPDSRERGRVVTFIKNTNVAIFCFSTAKNLEHGKTADRYFVGSLH
jgi:hypothetical protein